MQKPYKERGERTMKNYATQKDAIFEVLDTIGGVDIYEHHQSNLSYIIESYGNSDCEYYESEITFDEKGNLVSVVETEHYH